MNSIFRHLSKNRIQFSIVLVGLVLGWSGFISIAIYFHKELTYDQFHENSERIFRVTYNEKAGEIHPELDTWLLWDHPWGRP